MPRKPLPALAVLAMLSGSALAQSPAPGLPGVTPETRGAAELLIRRLGMDGIVQQMLAAMRDEMVRMLVAQSRLSAERVTPIVDEVLLPEFQSRSGEMLAAIAEIWAANFSVAELEELRRFYETPLGAKTLSLMPQLAQQGMLAGQAWGRRTAEMAMAKHREALRARGLNL